MYLVTNTAPEGAVRKHLDWMRVRNLSPQTIYSRGRALARLSKHFDDGPVLYLDEGQMKAWQVERSRTLEPMSQRAEMSAVREFYRWAVREGLRDTDPTARLDLPRVPRRHPRPIPDALLARAIETADVETAAILGLGAFAGLRAMEIARLDWSEVELESSRPMVHVAKGKGGHSRSIRLSPVLVELLRALPTRRGPVIRRIDGKAGHNLPHRISSRANDYLHEQGITQTLHQTRHRFLTVTYQACQDLRAVQELAGHASPTTTAVYAAAASKVAQDAVLAAGTLDIPAA